MPKTGNTIVVRYDVTPSEARQILYQYDKGMKLRIERVPAPYVVSDFHFQFEGQRTSYNVRATLVDAAHNDYEATIPNALLMKHGILKAYAYVQQTKTDSHGAVMFTTGYTKYEVTIYVKQRGIPRDVMYTTADQDAYDALAASINNLLQYTQDLNMHTQKHLAQMLSLFDTRHLYFHWDPNSGYIYVEPNTLFDYRWDPETGYFYVDNAASMELQKYYDMYVLNKNQFIDYVDS